MLLFAGIYNDLGSGSNVDLCIITKGKVDYKRNVELLMGKTYSRQKPVRYAPGTARKGSCFADAFLLLHCDRFAHGITAVQACMYEHASAAFCCLRGTSNDVLTSAEPAFCLILD